MRGWRSPVVSFLAAVFLGGSVSVSASTREERAAAWGVFIAAKDNIVEKCLYRPKPEEVVWGALAGLARDLGPDYARFFPAKRTGSVDDALDAYERTLRAIEDEGKLSLKTLVARSIRAYCRSVDRYSDYDVYETWAKVHAARGFNNVGIGLTLVDRTNEGFILHPFPDGPGERAGILGGDYLLEVNGQSVRGVSKDEVAAMCLGKAGTPVTLKLRHFDGAVESIAIVREQFTASPLTVTRTTAGYRVSCREISERTLEDFRILLRTMRPEEDLIIDLRGCGVGTVPAAVKMASLFLPTDAVVGKLETAQGPLTLVSSNKTPYHPSKLTILQDRFTASAAELVIVALVGNGKLHVETRGERTFGKGVTEMQVEISADAMGKTTAGILSITDTRIYGPNNEVWDGDGLAPTVGKN